ncbi:MAG: acyl carrier protein [Deltaproteobacteria bacterium]|nr:acyl carrier protein [Deltaproteobacteria bacterium]
MRRASSLEVPVIEIAEPTTVLEEIARVVHDELGVARPVDANVDLLQDLALDSLAILTLVVALEDRFRVALKEEDAGEIRTAGELAQLVARRAREQA